MTGARAWRPAGLQRESSRTDRDRPSGPSRFAVRRSQRERRAFASRALVASGIARLCDRTERAGSPVSLVPERCPMSAPHRAPSFRDLSPEEAIAVLARNDFGRLAFTMHNRVDV